MSDKEPPNPFEEIQKQLKELFKDSNVKVSAHQFSENDPFADEFDGAPPKGTAEAEKSSAVLENIRNFKLKPKEIRDYLNRMSHWKKFSSPSDFCKVKYMNTAGI